MMICNDELCTGCGMCVNVCPKQAISMKKGLHDFLYPSIDNYLCCKCGLCRDKCPANIEQETDNTVKDVYAAWNKNKTVRGRSTSGGIFGLLSEKVISDGGMVAGVRWTDDFHAQHYMIDFAEDITLLNGSKYVQSNTKDIYFQVKTALANGKEVLFSGTPCQNHALRSFLGKGYDNLYQIDLVCHGVPSYEMLERYLNKRKEVDKTISNIRLRYKNPYWDYCSVRIDFTDGSKYEKYTVDDSYFTLFNIGYSLRDRCRRCKYTNTHRYSDITLADFWGYSPKNFKMHDFLKGTSLILVNSDRGDKILNSIKNNLVIEPSTIDKAISGNKALEMPFSPPQSDVNNFWSDYENQMSVDDLCKKYVPHPFVIPNHLWLRRLKKKYKWVLKRK